MGDALGHLGTAAAFKALEVNHDHVPQVLQSAMSQHLRALAYQAFGLHTLQANLLAAPREHQWTQLQKAELRGFASVPGKPDSELDFHRTSHRVFTNSHKLIENGGQGKQAVLE